MFAGAAVALLYGLLALVGAMAAFAFILGMRQ